MKLKKGDLVVELLKFHPPPFEPGIDWRHEQGMGIVVEVTMRKSDSRYAGDLCAHYKIYWQNKKPTTLPHVSIRKVDGEDFLKIGWDGIIDEEKDKTTKQRISSFDAWAEHLCLKYERRHLYSKRN